MIRQFGARSRRSRLAGIAVFMLLAWTAAARAQYTLEDAHDPRRYEPGFTGIPFVFYSDSFNLAGGVAGSSGGFIQPQSDINFLGIGTLNATYGLQGGMDNIQIKPIDRLFLDWQAGYFRFTRDQVYLNGDDNASTPHAAGSNNSSKSNFLYSVVNDVYGDFTFKYLLPLGGGKEHIIDHYVLEEGLPVSGGSGGEGFNPFCSGRTFLELTPFFDYQKVKSSEVFRHHYDTNGLRAGVVYDNTDFPLSPGSGNIARVEVSHDFGSFRSSTTWTNITGEFTQYVPLGESAMFRQQVLALDAWTGYAPTQAVRGQSTAHGPPYYDSANLGGDTRLRAFPDGRFHDRAGVYGSAELRVIPNWNPLGNIGFLKKADIAWWQWVVFGEIGRVGGDYEVDQLLTHLKGDAGFGIRILSQDTVFRVDVAASNEGYSVWANLGQAF